MTVDRMAIVTGAAGPLGSATVAQFLQRGYRVACTFRAPQPDAVIESGHATDRVIGIQADLCREDDARRVVARAFEWAGRIDCLVNNAGVTGTLRTPFREIDNELWARVLTDTTAMTLYMSRAVVDVMSRQPTGGCIVNISSNTAAFGMANYMQYNAAKSAIVGMTKSMARELGPYNIRVNAVAPGLVETDRTRASMKEEYWADVLKGQCIGRRLQPMDIAMAVVFLGSDDNQMITGQTLLVNGGATLSAF